MKYIAAIFLVTLLTGSYLSAQTATAEIKNEDQPAAAIETDSKPENHAASGTEKTETRDTLTIWGEARARYEAQDNFNSQFYGNRSTINNMRDPANTFLLGRAIAGFTFAPFDFISLSLGAGYANVWSSTVSEEDYYSKEFGRFDNADKDSIEPYNCFIELKDPFFKIASVKTGRQLMNYGNGLVFSSGDWSNTTRWIWDATVASLEYNDCSIDAFYGRTMVHDPDEFSLSHHSGYKSAGFYGHTGFPFLFKETGIEPFAFTKNNRECHSVFDGREYDSYASERTPKVTYGELKTYFFGVRIYGKDFHGFDFDATYVKENGKYSTDKIDACAYHALIGYSAEFISVKPGISFEYSYASGDRNYEDGIRGTYDGGFSDPNLFGKMGLFVFRNIIDYRVNFKVKPIEELGFTISYHRLKLAEAEDHWYLADARTQWYESSNSRTIYGRFGDDLGQQVEATVRIKVVEGSFVEFGYARLLIGNFVKSLPNTNDNKHYAQLFYFQWETRIDFHVL